MELGRGTKEGTGDGNRGDELGGELEKPPQEEEGSQKSIWHQFSIRIE